LSDRISPYGSLEIGFASARSSAEGGGNVKTDFK
jgi:hypothetical protein